MKTHFQTTEGRQSLGKSLKISMDHWNMQGTEMFLVKSVAKWEEKWRASISIDSKISLRGGFIARTKEMFAEDFIFENQCSALRCLSSVPVRIAPSINKMTTTTTKCVLR